MRLGVIACLSVLPALGMSAAVAATPRPSVQVQVIAHINFEIEADTEAAATRRAAETVAWAAAQARRRHDLSLTTTTHSTVPLAGRNREVWCARESLRLAGVAEEPLNAFIAQLRERLAKTQTVSRRCPQRRVAAKTHQLIDLN